MCFKTSLSCSFIQLFQIPVNFPPSHKIPWIFHLLFDDCTFVRLWPLTCLCGFPPGLLYVLLRLIAEFNFQLLGLHLQILLPVCQGFTCLRRTQKQWVIRGNPQIYCTYIYYYSHYSLFMLASDFRAAILVSSFNLLLIHTIESFLLFCT